METPLATDIALRVDGMSCEHCKAKIEKSLAALDGVSKVEVNLADNTVLVSGRAPLEQIKSRLDELGYEVK